MAKKKSVDDFSGLYSGDNGAAKLYVGDLGLGGTWEVAQLLGVERSRIARWLDENEKGRPKIPPPVARLKCGPIWRLDDIVAAQPEIDARRQRDRVRT